MAKATVAALRREIAIRDLFLSRVSRGLLARVAAVSGKPRRGLRELQAFARELAIVAGDESALVPQRRRVDLNALARQVVSEHAAEHRPPIHVESTHRKLVGRLDPDQLATAISELVTNAIKYGGGEPISLELRAAGESISIAVLDAGPGIPRGMRLGRRFTRGPGAHTRLGFGVGIWLTRRIAAAHGGELRISRRRGGGTRARLVLPRQARG
jgi:signal transduction histidine kinase